MKIILAALLLLPIRSFAILGERAGPNVKSLSAMRTFITKNSVRYFSSTEKATTIREYLDENGFVYAISWQGPRTPNLNVLLGRFYGEYAIASAMTPRIRGHRNSRAVASANIEIRFFGHMRDFRGVAYIKGQLPANVNWVELQ